MIDIDLHQDDLRLAVRKLTVVGGCSLADIVKIVTEEYREHSDVTNSQAFGAAFELLRVA